MTKFDKWWQQQGYVTDDGCYLNMDESIAATKLKERFIEILKEELL